MRCDKNWVFANRDALPECGRDATHEVVIKVKEERVTVLCCGPCTSIFRVRFAQSTVITPITAPEENDSC